MKRILLLRHAKSDWKDYTLADFDRPLSPRGRKAAPRIAGWIRDNDLLPDRVLCSAARRTSETWERMAPALGEIPVVHRRALYHASTQAIVKQLIKQDDTADTVAVVGHNPAIAEFAYRYSVFGNKKKIARLTRKYPTGALAVISFRISSWADLPGASGTLEHFVRPKQLK